MDDLNNAPGEALSSLLGALTRQDDSDFRAQGTAFEWSFGKTFEGLNHAILMVPHFEQMHMIKREAIRQIIFFAGFFNKKQCDLVLGGAVRGLNR